MSKPDAGFDYDRYRKLLAEATDEPKRLAFIILLVDEKAKDSLARQSLRGKAGRPRPADKVQAGSRLICRKAERISGAEMDPAAARVSSCRRLPLQRCRASRWSG
jgi:hypothetical protein